MARLLVSSPGHGQRVFGIHKALTSIGSAQDNDVVINDAQVAATQCFIRFDGKLFRLGSSGNHKIWVNGKLRKRHELCDRDRFRLGDSEVTFILSELAAGEVGQPRDVDSPYRLLCRLGEKLLGRYQIDELLEELLDAVIEVCKADKGFLILLDDGHPSIRVARNLRRESIEGALDQLSDSIVAKVIKTKLPVIVSDALNDAEFSSAKSILRLNVASAMCVPLLDQGALVGLIYLGNDRILELFETASLDVLKVFSAQASLLIKNAMLVNTLKADCTRLSEELAQHRFGEIVGASRSMQQVYKIVDRVATTDVSVLITGETGTGKELIAKEIHRRSGRSAGPFVGINCGALSESLLESELFGHVKGAFTGALSDRPGKFRAAHGGTLFLDEVGEMPAPLQVKLLRALQEKSIVPVGSNRVHNVDIRVIAATNRDLESGVKSGQFREDLYYRLNVVRIALPALRDRDDDVLLIARYLLKRFADEFNSPVRAFSPDAVAALKTARWSGNIRQLDNHIRKAVVLADGPVLTAGDLEIEGKTETAVLPLSQAKEEFQRRYINDVLARNQGNRTRTAKQLGVDPRTIFRHLEREDNERADADSADER